MAIRQEQFEKQAHIDAVRKLEQDLYKAKQRAYYSSTLQAQQTIKALTLPMASDLVAFVEKIAKGRAVTTAPAALAPELLQWLEHVKPEHVTVVLLKTILDTHGAFENPTISRVSNFIGSRLEDELRFRYYEITAPEEVVKAAWRRVTETGSTPKYRRVSTKLITEKMLDELAPDLQKWRKWDGLYTCGMGLLLLEFAKTYELIVDVVKRQGKKTTRYISLSPRFVAMHEQCYEQMQSVAYMDRPLIEPPIHWQVKPGISRENCSGGYHSPEYRENHPMCRGYSSRSEFGDLSTRFLNTVGETAWCVDHAVIEVAQALREKGISVKSFNAYQRPDVLDSKMPGELVNLPTDHPDRVDWRNDMARLHQQHNKAWRKAIRSVKSLEEAKSFLKYPRFFLSWSADYRGRVYSQQPWLNPQTTEFEKSIIQFADGCKLDKRGLYWVKQAIGAAYLGTSLSLEDRAKWADNNSDLINRVGSDPLSNVLDWEAAKEPWQFLQLCIEWYKVVVTKQQALWHVPIGADATASGLQILSSMLRDPVGMKYSNVLPPENQNDPPQDAYMRVLEAARGIASNDPALAYLKSFLVHRGLGKTTMQMLYGATHRTVREKVIEVLIDQQIYRSTVWTDGKPFEVADPTKLGWRDAEKIATLIEQASRQVFPAAYAALDWLAKLAKLAAVKSPDEFIWYTPSGDKISLIEYETETADIRTSHLGKVRVPLSRNKTINHKAMKAALPPSLVHSYDAALLKIAFDGWERPIAVIHDCQKCLPTDMDRALEGIRKAFYAICQGDPLDALATSLNVSPDELPRLKQGNGKLEAVLSSTYLFN